MSELPINQIINSLDRNLQFVSELLQATIRVLVKRESGAYSPNKIRIQNYFHPNQDSLYIPHSGDYQKEEKFLAHKDVLVDKAFRLGKPVVGQYGLVINNRRIQEFAYPININSETLVVIAVERDIYLTRDSLGRYWDLIADTLIKALKTKIETQNRFPHIAFGEGALILRKSRDSDLNKIFFANPLAVNLLSEIAERVSQLAGRSLEEVFGSYRIQYKGKDLGLSIQKIEEISLRQRSVVLRYVEIDNDMTVVLIKDNSEIKIQETLLQEIHHRVKNNLQTIVSLLRLQKRRHPELQEAFDEAINRTNSIALVHEFLARSNDIEKMDFGFLVQKILRELLSSYGVSNISVNFECPEKIYIESENGTNLAIVLNEILSNSLEHVGSKLSALNIRLVADSKNLEMIVEDDGGGFEEGFDYKKSTGLGWGIVQTITEESLGGILKVENYSQEERRGLRVSLRIPLSF